MHKKSLFALALLAALPFAASAQDEESESSGPFTFSASATLTSDYVFRGISQSQEDWALQGELAFEHESGFYGGIWGSSVDFIPDDASYLDEDGANLELDLYVGYSWDLADKWVGDVQVVRYVYPGTNEGVDYDYAELIGSVSYDEMITATIGYSNDVYNLDDDGIYFGLSGSYGLPWWDLSLDGEVGHYSIGSGEALYDEHGDFIGADDLNYMHYSIGLSKEFGQVSTSLTWSDTDDNATDYYGEIADPRLFFSVTLATDL
ncbi:MAG: hypothetical protein IPO95_11865 [Rhodanobacteraceae bacterium]|nr:hypothetical protein [Rhodanobacteraceae bacterium]MBL0042455.1 hypothetical protein [Xanthomonadales bacterium]MBP6077297.1 TorF family putative porin [Xanthomonadales bacterium]